MLCIYIFLIQKKKLCNAGLSWLFIMAFKILKIDDVSFSH